MSDDQYNEDDQEAGDAPVADDDVDPRDDRIAELEAALAAAAIETEGLSQGLFSAQVNATGRLLDPTALPYDAALVNNPEGLDAAIASVLMASPWLAKVIVSGNIDQDTNEDAPVPGASLLGALKEFAD